MSQIMIGLQGFILADITLFYSPCQARGQSPPRGLSIYIRFLCHCVGRTVESHMLSTTPFRTINHSSIYIIIQSIKKYHKSFQILSTSPLQSISITNNDMLSPQKLDKIRTLCISVQKLYHIQV